MLPVRAKALNILVALAFCLTAVGASHAQDDVREQSTAGGPTLAFPTDNNAILDGAPNRFYMGLERTIGRNREFTWEGGTYGYVRNARSTPAGYRFTRFHEGVDIAPVDRDAEGEPLDEVRTIDDGVVAYVNSAPGRSDYGRYIVVEHIWEGSPFYSLYAHLGETTVRVGERLRRGDHIGVLGYSGRGLNRARAHLHFEVTLMLSEDFEIWRDELRPRWPTHHGQFHGFNLAGIPPMELLLHTLRSPGASILEMLTTERAEVTAIVPGGPPPGILLRHPWLCRTCGSEAPPEWARSWEVGFTRAGRPVSIDPSNLSVTGLELGRVDPIVRADYLHSRILTRQGPGGNLNDTARSLLPVTFTTDRGIPQW